MLLIVTKQTTGTTGLITRKYKNILKIIKQNTPNMLVIKSKNGDETTLNNVIKVEVIP